MQLRHQRILFLLACVVSGFIWGALGFLLAGGKGAFDDLVVGGVWFSPVIGLAIGFWSLSVYRKRAWMLIPWSLVTLYIAVALFGLGVGIYDAQRPIPNRIPDAVVMQAISAAISGVTLYFLWLLWPLSWLNHFILRAVSRWLARKRLIAA